MSLESQIQDLLAEGKFDEAQQLIGRAKKEVEKTKRFIHRTPAKKTAGKSKKFIKKFKNTFNDDGSLCQADGQWDKKYPTEVIERTRPPAPDLVMATCDICGKKEKVHPIMIHKTIVDSQDKDEAVQSYRCNKCCGKG